MGSQSVYKAEELGMALSSKIKNLQSLTKSIITAEVDPTMDMIEVIHDLACNLHMLSEESLEATTDAFR